MFQKLYVLCVYVFQKIYVLKLANPKAQWRIKSLGFWIIILVLGPLSISTFLKVKNFQKGIEIS